MAQGGQSVLKRVAWFVRRGVWTVRLEGLPWPQRGALGALRLAALAAVGFKRDQCALRAASLTFFSMMALVPILVLALAMARTFNGADLAKAQLDRQLDAWMAQMEQSVENRAAAAGEADRRAQAEVTQVFSAQVREISDKLYEQVNRINFGTLGGVGLVMLLWTVVGMLGKVETSFNQIWGVTQPRSLLQKCAYYLFISIVLPFLSTAASTVPVAGMVIRALDQTVGGPAAEGLRVLLNSGLLKAGITLSLGTATFGFLLGVMPNTRVRVLPALAGGFVTVVLFGGWLKLCAMLQVGIAKYSALYGGFATLPILLMWVYTSWQIILLGAEIACVVQNRDTYVRERVAAAASPRARLLLALALCAETARLARDRPGGPFAALAYVRRRGVPQRFAREVLDCLVRGGLLAEVAGRPGEYLLCRCGAGLAASEVARLVLDDGEAPEALGLDRLDAPVAELERAAGAALDAALAAPVAALLPEGAVSGAR